MCGGCGGGGGGDMNTMKRCELCKGKARILCESDKARLCWSCDARVHSANFLVARHSRNLLCHVCRSATPWSASGAKLRPTFAVCEMCIVGGRRGGEVEEAKPDGEVEEVVDENQVVPWSTPPPAADSSSGEDDSDGDAVVSRKRCRLADAASSDSDPDEDESYSSCQPSFTTASPPKIQKSTGSEILNQRRGSFHEETNTNEDITEYSNSTFP